MRKKLVSIRICVFNEIENIPILTQQIKQIFDVGLQNYDYEIIFSDNKSTDGTREWIIANAAKDKHIKAIFNSNNMRDGSGLNLCKVDSGDCAIFMGGDLQDPTDMIPKFIEAWESGYKIVIGIKSKSEENKLMFIVRSYFLSQ